MHSVCSACSNPLPTLSLHHGRCHWCALSQFHDTFDDFIRTTALADDQQLLLSNLEVLSVFAIAHSLSHIASHLVSVATEMRQLAYAWNRDFNA